MDHAGDFREGVLHVHHCVFVVNSFIPHAVIPFSKNICNVIDFYVGVLRFLWQIFQAFHGICGLCTINP